MTADCVYLDNQSTTRVDPRVVEAMLPYFTENFGNPGSTSHCFGWAAKDAVENSRNRIAELIGAKPKEIIFTSGATESNNLALRGVAERYSQKGKHIVSVATEHRAVLDPLDRLTRRGFEVDYLSVRPHDHSTIETSARKSVDQSTAECPGQIDLDQLRTCIRDDTILVSAMLANNETGVIQLIPEVAKICRDVNVFLHCDATQAVGKIPVDVESLNADLISFTSHKMYGPRGIGALYIRRRSPQIRLTPQIDGGAQENGLRSGTLNVPGIVGFAKALELCIEELETESKRQYQLRQLLYDGIRQSIADTWLNGPTWSSDHGKTLHRLPGNLNMGFRFVDGEALMMSMGNLAVSSGSACSSANPEPSHVLTAMGLSDDEVRSSLRFGIGRFNTESDILFAIETVTGAVSRLRKMSSMA